MLASCGFILHFIELIFINKMWGTTVIQDYVIGTYFYGTGVALIALSNVKWLALPRAASIGPLVLGVYASHFIFIDLLAPFNRYYFGSIAWDILYSIIIFMLSYAFTLYLSQYKLTKKLVV